MREKERGEVGCNSIRTGLNVRLFNPQKYPIVYDFYPSYDYKGRCKQFNFIAEILKKDHDIGERERERERERDGERE